MPGIIENIPALNTSERNPPECPICAPGIGKVVVPIILRVRIEIATSSAVEAHATSVETFHNHPGTINLIPRIGAVIVNPRGPLCHVLIRNGDECLNAL